MPETLEVRDTGYVLASDVEWATTIARRTRGLLDRPRLARGQGLVLSPAKQVHTFGMTYPIDVVFCDRSWRVRHVCRGLRPRKVTRPVMRSHHAVELPCGAVPRSLGRGDVLRVVSCSAGGRRG